MSATTYLFLANCTVWLGVTGYLVFLSLRAGELEKRMRQLELLGGGDNDRS